jgi:hypothetical protein
VNAGMYGRIRSIYRWICKEQGGKDVDRMHLVQDGVRTHGNGPSLFIRGGEFID